MKNVANIFEFIDYRAYLKALYTGNREIDPAFSYRVMVHALNFSSPNFLKLVIDGDRDIGADGIQKIINGLSLSSKQSAYFRLIVAFSKAKMISQKNAFLEEILDARSRMTVSHLQEEQFEFFSKWYNPVIRELVRDKNKSTVDYAEIAKKITPRILPKEVKKAVALLEKLQLVRVNESGNYEQTNAFVRTNNELGSLAVKQYHTEMIKLAAESIENVPGSDREIGALTVKVSKEGFFKLKKRLQNLREELLDMVKQDSLVNRVYQVNIQLFPLSEEDD